MTKEQALSTDIMLLSALLWIEKPTRLIADERRKMYKKLQKKYLVKGKATPEYEQANQATIDAWSEARKEFIKPEGNLPSSMEAVVETLWNRLSRTEYKSILIKENKIQRIIESFYHARKSEKWQDVSEDEAVANGRKLVNKFFEILGVKDNNPLAGRSKIIRGNLITDGKTIDSRFQ